MLGDIVCAAYLLFTAAISEPRQAAPMAVVLQSQSIEHTAPDAANRRGAVRQMRIYELPPENEANFHMRFRNHTLRIMKRHGFAVGSIWRGRRDDGIVEFIYLLDWPDAATMQQSWAAFLADTEWQDIKRQSGARHGRFVNVISDRVLEPLHFDTE